jgi:ABC-type transport system substrate-binding protein
MTRIGTALWLALGMLVILLGSPGPAGAQKKTLVVALNQDPDILDPTLSRTYVGRVVFSQICEKLYEIDDTIYLYHPNYIVAFPKHLKSYKAVPDGLIRVKGLSWN